MVELRQFNYFMVITERLLERSLRLIEVALVAAALLMKHDQFTVVQIKLRDGLFVLRPRAFAAGRFEILVLIIIRQLVVILVVHDWVELFVLRMEHLL